MYRNTREFIKALGGYRLVAVRLDKKLPTVHSHIQADALPPAWYDALCKMARDAKLEEPERGLFSFLQLPLDESHHSSGGAA